MELRPARDIWETALGELELEVNKPNYRTWLKKTVGVLYQDNEFTIAVPNIFVAEYLERNQRSLIEKVLINLLHKEVKAVFKVNSLSSNIDEGAVMRREVAAQTSGVPGLSSRYTFDSFVVGDCNRLAYAAAREIAEKPGKTYNPLFIYGDAGLGKTHLLQAIGHEAQETNYQIIYVSGEEFTNDFVSAVQARHMESFRQRYRSVDMLLIDDIQFISGKEQTEICFFHTFNELHNASRQIVMTCDQAPSALSTLSERLRSRFSWGLATHLDNPDTETRKAILRLRAEKEGANLSQDVLELIAEKINHNIRELEGSLNRVIAYAKLLKTNLTPELAAQALADIGDRAERPQATPQQVISIVARSFGLTPQDILGKRRSQKVALARGVVMYLLRQYSGLSLAEIGGEIGSRKAFTVSHTCARVEKLLPSNPQLRHRLLSIKESLPF